MSKFLISFSVIFIFGISLFLPQGDAKCSRVLNRKVNGATAQFIVKKHNELRDLITKGKVPNQPKAVNMNELNWDTSLAKDAQEVADRCLFKHYLKKDARWHDVGQNIHISRSTAQINSANWTQAVDGWFDEYKNYTYPDNPTNKTGHFTQMVWAKTRYVGCGYTFFANETDLLPYQKLYVCNYGPAGNYKEEAPYKTNEEY